MFDSLIKTFAPMIIKEVSSSLSEALFSIPGKLIEKAKETDNKLDDVLATVVEMFFLMAKGDMQGANDRLSQAPKWAREFVVDTILWLHEKSKETKTPVDNIIVGIIARVFNVDLKG